MASGLAECPELLDGALWVELGLSTEGGFPPGVFFPSGSKWCCKLCEGSSRLQPLLLLNPLRNLPCQILLERD